MLIFFCVENFIFIVLLYKYRYRIYMLFNNVFYYLFIAIDSLFNVKIIDDEKEKWYTMDSPIFIAHAGGGYQGICIAIC